MLEGLDALLRALSDGGWHRVGELAERLEVRAEDVEEAARLLSKYGMAVYDAEGRRVRLSEPMLRFLRGRA
jgi:Mn-dependent DtxR family transcriptional regulator